VSAEGTQPATEYVLGKFTGVGFTITHRYARLQDAIHAWANGGYTLRRVVRGEAQELTAAEFARANALLRGSR
jgi:hypothetical protein